ncbi:MAG: excinuclease ABC subunit UvrA [Bacteroidota bacterium]
MVSDLQGKLITTTLLRSIAAALVKGSLYLCLDLIAFLLYFYSMQRATPPSQTKKPFLEGDSFLEVIGGREHNLKNVNLAIPHYRLVLFTGVSGCGKSSLLHDIIYTGAHCRYLGLRETNYVNQLIQSLDQPEVDELRGLQAVIGIRQETTTSRTPRSTVGTSTEITALLRLLFARIADAYSYLSGEKMVRQSDEQIERFLMQRFEGKKVLLLAPMIKNKKGHYRELFSSLYKKGYRQARVNGVLRPILPSTRLERYKNHHIEAVVADMQIAPKDLSSLREKLKEGLELGRGTLIVHTEGKKGTDYYLSRLLMDPATGLAYDEATPNTFSFNSPQGACPVCQGLGNVQTVDEKELIPNPALSFQEGGIPSLNVQKYDAILQEISFFLEDHGYTLSTPIQQIKRKDLDKLLYGGLDPIEVVKTRSLGLVSYLLEHQSTKKMEEELLVRQVCPCCEGKRLKKEALHFKIDGKNIADLSLMDLRMLYEWFEKLSGHLTSRQHKIADELLKEIRTRLRLLLHIGLDYLHLFRPVQTLSGGENQRLRLATQIGTQLVGVMYILDEPSIGLHQRDNEKLIQALKSLRDLGNSVLVIEHDKDTMLAADYLIEIGHGAGQHGGKIVAQGIPKDFLKQKSTTADYLTGKRSIPVPQERRKGNSHLLTLKGCSGHNLKNASLTLPLGKFITVTGVSGSGKSTLINRTLLPALYEHLGLKTKSPLPYESIDGLAHIDKVIQVSQSPIGRTPRSNPATYTGLFTSIRDLFAQLPESKIRGYKVGRFSFNVKGGRCATCQGGGIKLIQMDFLPNTRVPCETCEGRRYNRETLEIHYRGKSIADVLSMTVEEALAFFEKHPKIHQKINALMQVGLGYITLGQHATTLSGGEAQRVKLATELAKKDTGKTLYILDEPTTGLHFQDIHQLLKVLHKLVEKGNTIIVIEHNLDVIKVADHIIDLGPEGGGDGGSVVVTGTPEEVAKHPISHTARFLRKELEG